MPAQNYSFQYLAVYDELQRNLQRNPDNNFAALSSADFI